MFLGPGIASLMFWALKSLRCPGVLGTKIAFYWELMYKNPPMGAVVYMALYGVGFRRLYPLLGVFEGGCPAARACFRPCNCTSDSECDYRAQINYSPHW